MATLRPPQQKVLTGIYAHWQSGKRNVLGVLPTGGGKSVVASVVSQQYAGASISIAHRGELVSQLALALARQGIRHRIIGPTSLIKSCTVVQMDELKRSYVDPGGRVGVASVDTLIKRGASDDSFWRAVGMWQTDEAHHVQADNKWYDACMMFPNAYGLGWTATPGRADGGGLGTVGLGGSGLFEAMVLGATPRDLIGSGYLTDYRIFCPPSDVDYSEVTVTATGDYSLPKLRAAVHRSRKIVGDVVAHYLRLARGKRGITFAVDIEAAQELARAYRAADVPAEVVHAKTDDVLRGRILRDFRAGRVLQLVNVDLFGEGFDVPACEVVSMVRKTESFALYAQQFGRMLRLMIPQELQEVWGTLTDEQRLVHIAASPKPWGMLIDHVGNVARHGLPDAPREWSLANRERGERRTSDAIPLTICRAEGCYQPYERFRPACPYCGFRPEPQARTAPEFVDGDLLELDPTTLATMRGEVARIMGAPPVLPNALANAGMQKQWAMRQAAVTHLRNAINLWGGWQAHDGLGESESYRKFFLTYGLDVLSAQAQGERDALALRDRIMSDMAKHGVTQA